MNPRATSRTTALLVVLIIAFMLGLGSANARFTESAADANEFLPRWEGARAWLTAGASPYDPQVSRAVQIRLYGREAVPGQGEDLGLFGLPLPAMLLYAPWGLLDYPAARAGWMTLLEILLVVASVLSVRLASWRPPTWLLALLVAFGVAWPPGIRSIVDGHTAILALAATLASIYCIERGWDAAAGFLLALAMADPTVGLLVLVAGLAWAASTRRPGIIVAALSMTAVLVAASLALMPGWPMEWLRQVSTALEILRDLGPAWGLLSEHAATAVWILAAVLALAAAGVLWTCLGKGPRWLLWSMSALLVLGTWLVRLAAGTSTSVYLLPAVMLVLGWVAQRVPRLGSWIVAGGLLVVGVGSWVLFLGVPAATDGGSGEGSLAPALAFLGLLWVRWWVTRGADVRGLSFEGPDA